MKQMRNEVTHTLAGAHATRRVGFDVTCWMPKMRLHVGSTTSVRQYALMQQLIVLCGCQSARAGHGQCFRSDMGALDTSDL